MMPKESRGEEERLHRENQELRRQLEELKGAAHGDVETGLPDKLWRPSAITIWSIFLVVVMIIAVAFLSGYIPLQKRRAVIAGEAHEQERALPRVEVIEARRATGKSTLQLPGNIQAITEAPILARADGYILRRTVDIGDRVQAGQTVAEIEAPEMEAQVRQSKANLQLARAAVDQALANYEQGKSDTELARVTAERWARLATKGVVSRQENDQYQAQYHSRNSALESLDKAVGVQRSNVAAAEASLARIERMQSYLVVKAPFDGVITLRNVDVGALVNAGSTLTVPDRADLDAAHLFERAAGAGQFGAGRSDRRGSVWPTCRDVNSRARWRAPPTRSTPPAERCWWRFMCPIPTAHCFPACMPGSNWSALERARRY